MGVLIEEETLKMLETRKIKEELDLMCEQGRSHTDMIHYLLGRFTGQDNIPYELIEYAMDLQPEVMVI